MIGKEFFDGLSGSGDCEAGRHSLVVVYGRPRRTLFCQRYALRRWPCDRWLPEPRLRGGWGYGVMAPRGPAGLRPRP